MARTTSYYVATYGRYGKHQITSYFMVMPQAIIKLDTHHKKMSHIKHTSWEQCYAPYRKRITKKEFENQMKNFDIIK